MKINLKKISIVLSICFYTVITVAQQKVPAYKNQDLPVDKRVEDLLKQLTVQEKISLIGFQSRPVERLGIPAYNWWNEALHGVARAGRATVFPQAIGMAATFNDELFHEVATVISTEARAKNNMAVAKDRRLQYMGLNFWSPNINIFRDPRWGRGQETYGEDPFLTGKMGTAFVKGMQGDNSKYMKTAACAKHFAVHSGPESSRHSFNAIVDEKDLRETYLYAFKKLVDANVESVMCAYNRVNSEPCCTGKTLLTDILHKEWGFKGHVVTDCWALQDIYESHKALPNSVAVAAAAIKGGVNMDCSDLLQKDAIKALEQKLITTKDIDNALAPSLRTQFKLGFYDKPEDNPYRKYGVDSIANSYHIGLSRKMAEQSMVLLKNGLVNGSNILPVNKEKCKSIMVVGPNAASIDALVGNYHGISDKAVNFVEGIVGAVSPDTRVEYDMGCDFNDTQRFNGMWGSLMSDLTVAVIGFNPVYEGEEGDAFLADGKGDRKNMELPASHIAYMKALRKGSKSPIVAVITGGGAVDVSSIEPYVDAIIFAWYPGEQGGTALANLIFGKVSPSGHLPITFYKSFSDLPDYNNYAMGGRTYRYFNKEVQYPFGFGLSYTTFDYNWLQKPDNVKKTSNKISMQIKIQNTGQYDADEVAQVYIEYPKMDRMPLKELKAFKRVSITKRNSQNITLEIPLEELQKWDEVQKKFQIYEGKYTVKIGSNSRDTQLEASFEIVK
ncbi:glycoside hydrolase family 3 N-terminal domain-containing protein [Flavobacterium gilvum]|uniref:Glycosyl hydrolase n=1 Tax=Flavobacterium gilvum TaxID=1492737 RepID=A0AAC9I3L7_9FLAO|nr:glycoside hydrolase family 3 N-terminal domain-containing protein [Flavobacterium gilvum]AOW10269.1 glycosyl hydrolase [Flavobacterium gilvum]KFC59488.1 beta-glucosidase [Flavobacterium gilvum]